MLSIYLSMIIYLFIYLRLIVKFQAVKSSQFQLDTFLFIYLFIYFNL